MDWDFLLNAAVALILGIAIGFVRQFRQRTAGLPTNALVCVRSSLYVSLGALLTSDPSSAGRIAAQVVSGIGFLGGGVILREGLNVRAMNTAATLWCSAAVGTLAGGGRLLEPVMGTVMVVGIHIGMRPVVRKIDERIKMFPDAEAVYRMHVDCVSIQAAVIRDVSRRHVNSAPNMAIQGFSRAIPTRRMPRKLWPRYFAPLAMTNT